MALVSIKILLDEELKAQFVSRARKDRLSMSAVIRSFLHDYVKGNLKVKH